MKTYTTILFDLDGTLTDPGEGITNAVAYALKQYGIHVADRRELYPFIGPPLHDSFMKFYGFSGEQAEAAIAFFREYYRDTGIWENVAYPGIAEALHKLCDSGKRLLVATSKPEDFAVRILDRFGLSQYFEHVCGATFDRTRVTKAQVIAHALQRGNISDISGCIMVGDREHDVLGAKEFGMDALGVLYGYGDADELLQSGARYTAKTPAEVADLLCR